MPAIRIRPLPDGERGPLGGPFAIEGVAESASAQDDRIQGAGIQDAGMQDAAADAQAVVATVVEFGRWISRGMTYYQNKGGIEDSSLFKSFAAECFEELARDSPEAAAFLTGLTVICGTLPASLKEDPAWLLHRAILASLPGIRFVE
jgi:hypothetical protein